MKSEEWWRNKRLMLEIRKINQMKYSNRETLVTIN